MIEVCYNRYNIISRLKIISFSGLMHSATYSWLEDIFCLFTFFDSFFAFSRCCDKVVIAIFDLSVENILCLSCPEQCIIAHEVINILHFNGTMISIENDFRGIFCLEVFGKFKLLILCLEWVELLRIGDDFSLNFLINLLRQIHVPEPQNKPHDI